jgi:putative Mg2+ transporter-C (MgtC) family protein
MVYGLDLVISGQLLIASLLGGLIGLERELHGRPAGFRTHLLVSLGSCLFVAVSIHFYRVYGNFSGTGPIGVDPGRVAAQVVAGIGFLGAGAIIKDKASVRGLTTAASLWVAAAVGLACGVGLLALAVLVTALALVSLLFLKKIESRLSRDTYVTVTVWSVDIEGQMSRIEQLMQECLMKVVKLNIEKDVERHEVKLKFETKFSTQEMACRLIDGISGTSGVKRVRLD